MPSLRSQRARISNPANNTITNRNPLPILGSRGTGKDAADAFHSAMQNLHRSRVTQDKPVSLGTHYSADETPEGTDDIHFDYELQKPGLPPRLLMSLGIIFLVTVGAMFALACLF
jgi:hypothetical protein